MLGDIDLISWTEGTAEGSCHQLIASWENSSLKMCDLALFFGSR